MGTTELNNRSCLVLAGGEILDYAAVKAQIEDDMFVICADSGFSHCGELGVKPDLLVGDFDSIGSLPQGVSRLDFPAEKDYTDSALAIRHAHALGCRRMLLAGMLGGRFDHSLSNVQNLLWCVNNGVAAKITDGRTEVFASSRGELVLTPRPDAYFSLFALSELCRAVTITGAKYPLCRYDLRFDDARAVSNEFCGADVRITFDSGALAAVVSPK